MVHPGAGRRLVVGTFVCALIVGAVVPGVGGAPTAAPGVESAVGGPEGLVEQHATPTNDTVRHEDPAEVNQRGDLEAVERYLAGRLSERLGEGTASISRGQYEAARSVLGDEYDAELARYVDVAGETESEADDEAAESFREAGNRSRSFTDEVQRFEETDEAYRRAVERGEEARARELARRLLDRSSAVDRAGRPLVGDLGSIENRTTADLSTSSERVRNVTGSVRARASDVAEATFARTRIEASASPTDVSFLRPTTVRGRLVDENGTALAGAPIQVGTDADAVTVQTNASGGFRATYRPVRLPAGPGAVAVRYVPENRSTYLGNRTNATVAVSPVTPSVTVATASESVAFGQAVTASGAVTVEDVPAPGVPVAASIDGVTVGRGVTSPDGTYAVSGPLPANVPVGDRELEVRVDQTGRAVARASTRSPLAVEPTETTLSLTGSSEGIDRVEVSGRLATVAGDGVEGQRVQLLLDGRPVESVRTGEGGRYAATLSPTDDRAGEGETVRVASRFAGRQTNLEASTAEAVLSLPVAASQPSTAEWFGRPWWHWFAVAVAIGLLATGGFVARQRASRQRTPEPATGERTTEVEPTRSRSRTDEGWREDASTLLSGREPDRAVEVAYGAVRLGLADALGASGALTHWEFYAAAGDDGVGDEALSALRSLTETYERARFAPSSVSIEAATAAVERAETVLGAGEPPCGATTD